MSVAPSLPVLAKHGHLSISGTTHNDQIDISQSGSTLRVSVDGYVSKFSSSSVADIAVLPSSGTDHVSVDAKSVHQPVTVVQASAGTKHHGTPVTPVTPTAPEVPAAGKTPAFFPIGVWLQPTFTFDAWKARGINTLVGYESYGGTVSMSTWTSAATAHGFKQIRPPSGNFAADSKDANLLAYLQQDEPDGKNISPATLLKNYSAWKAAAPNVPVFLNLDGSRVLGWQGNVTSATYRAYANTADYLGTDVYPVTGWNLPTKLGAPGDAAAALSGLSNGKSQFAFIEASDQELPWLPQSVPGPNTDQLRAEIWDSIIKGARGIVYFPQQIGYGFKYDNSTSPIVAEMTKQNARITSIGAALETASNPAGLSATVGSGFEATTRIYNGKKYYIVMNNTAKTMSSKTITLTGSGAATTATVDSEARNVSISQGKITDSFAPYETHAYIVG